MLHKYFHCLIKLLRLAVIIVVIVTIFDSHTVNVFVITWLECVYKN